MIAILLHGATPFDEIVVVVGLGLLVGLIALLIALWLTRDRG